MSGTSPTAERRQGRGAERGRLLLERDVDRPTEDVGLELHEEPVRGRAAVGAQHLELPRHRVDHVRDLEGDRLERRPRDVLARGAARDPADQAAGIGIPVRRAEPGQRRHEVDAPVESTCRASVSESAASEISPSPSRSHWMAAPLARIAPSSAYSGGRRARPRPRS